jgi:hypothetical protein
MRVEIYAKLERKVIIFTRVFHRVQKRKRISTNSIHTVNIPSALVLVFETIRKMSLHCKPIDAHWSKKNHTSRLPTIRVQGVQTALEMYFVYGTIYM